IASKTYRRTAAAAGPGSAGGWSPVSPVAGRRACDRDGGARREGCRRPRVRLEMRAEQQRRSCPEVAPGYGQGLSEPGRPLAIDCRLILLGMRRAQPDRRVNLTLGRRSADDELRREVEDLHRALAPVDAL